MKPATLDTSSTADREIVLSRVYDAPRELVWKAWAEAEHRAQWWGPAGFTLTTQRNDFRPGGDWRYIMHGPDGHDYLNRINYLEIIEHERLSYQHGGDVEGEAVNFHVTVTFEPLGEAGKQTRLTMRSTFASAEARDFVIRNYNALEGGKQHLQRLGEHLHDLQNATANQADGDDKPFVISRFFAAAPEQMWEVWTTQAHLQQWFGPKGFTIPQCSLDLREGGAFHYCMRGPGGHEMWGRWIFREIDRPKRLVFVSSFADAQGNLIREPSHRDWPLEMLATVTFAEHAGINRGTVVTVQWTALNATPAERRTFADNHDSMRQGWTGTFEQLAAFLAR